MARCLDLPVRLREAGFVSVFSTPIDHSRGAAGMAHDLSAMSVDESGLADWDVWLPTGSSMFEGIANKDAVIDVALLRLLAVGALCLRHIPVKRASSTFLSLDGLSMSRHFGANDLGYGAADESTELLLKLAPYGHLTQVLSK